MIITSEKASPQLVQEVFTEQKKHRKSLKMKLKEGMQQDTVSNKSIAPMVETISRKQYHKPPSLGSQQ